MASGGITVGIFGGTGNVGKHLLKRCLDEGYQVKALARKPEKLKDFECDNLTIVQGGVADKEAMKEVCRDTTVVVSALGNVGKHRIMSVAAENLVEINPTRVIFLSSLGMEDTSHCVYCLLRYCFAGDTIVDYEVADKILRDSNINVTCVRACNLEGTELGTAYGTEEKGCSVDAISKETCGNWLFEQIADEKWNGVKRVQVYPEGKGPCCCCALCFCCWWLIQEVYIVQLLLKKYINEADDKRWFL